MHPCMRVWVAGAACSKKFEWYSCSGSVSMCTACICGLRAAARNSKVTVGVFPCARLACVGCGLQQEIQMLQWACFHVHGLRVQSAGCSKKFKCYSGSVSMCTACVCRVWAAARNSNVTVGVFPCARLACVGCGLQQEIQMLQWECFHVHGLQVWVFFGQGSNFAASNIAHIFCKYLRLYGLASKFASH